MIEIKYYSKEFEAAHIEFAKRHWTKKRRLTPEYLYWKFRGGEGLEMTSFILAFDGNKVIGQFGLIPCSIEIGKELYEAQWACDLMIDSEYRGKGVADKLYDFAHNSKMITLGSDPSPAAEKSMVKKGYISIHGPRKFIFPFKIGEAFKLKGINNNFINKIPNPFILLFYVFKSKNFKKITTEEYAKLCRNNKDDDNIRAIYDEAFYEWRFSPFKSYYPGIDCYKKDDATFFSGYYVNGLYFMRDFQASNFMSYLKIISFIYFKYRHLNIQRIKFVSMHNHINFMLPFLGFIRFSTLTKIILFTKQPKIKEQIKDKKFNYNLSDSDENI